MIQIKVLSGKMAGQTILARRFPFQVGRAAGLDLTIEEPGVWDRHFAIHFEPGNGFIAERQGEALMTINGEAANQKRRLHNGDSIELAGTRLEFWLAETRQSGFRLREGLVWAGITLVTAAQLALICLLPR